MRRHSALINRIMAASLGGYLLTNTLSVFIAFVLPVPRAQAVAIMMLASFALYAAVIIRVFAVHSLRRVWAEIGLITLLSVLGSAAFHLLGDNL
ncbi:MAG: DUF3649 domain-containing protein [Porticoccaceae bacterium]|nr:DUF3649 domain-containing protein [Porticoccaceae bacterium]